MYYLSKRKNNPLMFIFANTNVLNLVKYHRAMLLSHLHNINTPSLNMSQATVIYSLVNPQILVLLKLIFIYLIKTVAYTRILPHSKNLLMRSTAVKVRTRKPKLRVKNIHFKRVFRKQRKLSKKVIFNRGFLKKHAKYINITLKHTKHLKIYRVRRKRSHIQFIKQSRRWLRNFKSNPPHAQTPGIRQISTKYLQIYTHFLISTYKKIKYRKKYKNIPLRNKKARFLYKNMSLCKNNSNIKYVNEQLCNKLCNKKYKPTHFIVTNTIISNRIKPNISSHLYLDIQKNNIIGWNYKGATPKVSAAYPKITKVRRKHQILSSLFVFHNSNWSSNSEISCNYINVPSLLNLKTTPFKQIVPQTLMLINKINTMRYLHINIFHNGPNQNIHSYTNFSPLFWILSQLPQKTNYSAILNKMYVRTLSNLNSQKYKNLYTFFLVNYLEMYLRKKLWIRSDCRDFFSGIWGVYLNKRVNQYRTLYWRFTRLIDVRELLEIIIIMFVTRDLQIFLIFLKRCFEKSHFKKHKKILSILFDILRKNKIILYRAHIKGFFFDIRGKVGVSGNAKKRHVSFSLDKITTTSQNVKSYWQQINIWTPTGQMGITCYILF